jgi:hypothetical protein
MIVMVQGETEHDWTGFQPALAMEHEEHHDHGFVAEQASGQVLFNPNCVWNDNAGDAVSCTFVIKNETTGPITDVSVHSTVNGKSGAHSPVTRSLAPGATAKGTLSWPFKPPSMEIMVQIWFGGAANGDKETHTVTG